jgi:cold shock CspA family protein
VLIALAISAYAAHNAGGSTVATGTVKWFGDERGFGFITPDDRSSFDAEVAEKGPKAVNVHVA